MTSEGATTAVRVERAVVRSRAQLNYLGVQEAADAGVLDEPTAVLPEIGSLLHARGRGRGAINLPTPEQELEPDDGGWRLTLRAPVPAEDWNAQISLLTGMRAQAAELLRGASYSALDDVTPEDIGHAGVGAPYAHVTAPLRRLADRYATEVCLSLAGGRDVPDWVRAALPQLPDVAHGALRAR